MNVVEKSLRSLWNPCSQMKDYERLKPLRHLPGRGILIFSSTTVSKLLMPFPVGGVNH